MNKAANWRQTLRRTLSRRILFRFVGAVMLYTLALLAAAGVLFLLYYSVAWRVEWIDRLAHALFGDVTGFVLSVILLLILGYGGLFFHYWNRTLRYLEDLVAATETVCTTGESVVLPEDLIEVEHRLNDIQREAQRNALAAQEAEQRKNDLVVYLAHDLKTPLTSVIGYLSLLTEEQEISPALREKYLGVALDRAYRLEDLINEFFEIARFSLTNLPLDLGRVDLSRMLEQIVYEFQPMLTEKHLTCKLSAPPEIQLLCDGNKLQRVFDNLLRNAVNYSYPDSEIVVIASTVEDRVCVQVINHGDPIRPEKLERLFEQFYRLDEARTSGTGGSGLGLAIAKEIVEQHGGEIQAYSDGGMISFTVELPMLSEKSQNFMGKS